MCTEDHDGNNKICYPRGRTAERQGEKKICKMLYSSVLDERRSCKENAYLEQFFVSDILLSSFSFSKFLF